MASRRWAQMIPEINKFYEVYVCTNNSTGDLPVPLNENRILRLNKIENYNFTRKRYNRHNLFHLLISFFTKKMRSIDSTILSWYWKNRKRITNYVQNLNPDIIITTTGPVSTALIGKMLKTRRPDIFWILDVRDILGPFDRNGKNWVQHLFDKCFEKYAIGKPDLIFTAGKYYSQLLSNFYKRKVHILYNGFPGKVKILNSSPSCHKQIYYAGKLYDHQIESFKLLVNTLKKTDWKIKLRLVGDKVQVNKIRQLLNSSNPDKFDLNPPDSSLKIHEEQMNSDILVVFEDLETNSKATKGTLTGKLFELLVTDIPILAICRKDSEISELLSKTERGKVVDSENGILDFINNCNQYKGNDIKKLEEYSRKNQAYVFMKILKGYLNEKDNKILS